MTANGSKGLEFDYVFLPYATEESWVSRSRGASFVLPMKDIGDGDIRDTRRLFYVAITRAKKHVVILPALEESDGRELTVLRFISELDQDYIVSTSLPRPKVAISSSTEERVTHGHNSIKILDLDKQTLSLSGLSVTALNHFLECPNKFLYESILKMPQAPSVSAVKGNAMHDAISRVWMDNMKASESITKMIISSSSEYVDDSFLSDYDY